uniref:Uncharacterized protein n=1 Tax=viral metagenome TaxID=1070528 RepID=A0A6M3IJR2_9ZZZZ
MSKKLFKSNTVRICIAAILGAWAAYCGGELELQTAIMSTVGALIGIFLRKGQGVPIFPAIILVACLALIGCQAAGPVKTPTGTTTTGGYVVGGEQEATGGTYFSLGGDITLNVTPNPGGNLPDKIVNAIEKIATDDRIPVEQRIGLIERLTAPYSISITLEHARAGDAETAGSTGRGTASGVPPMNDPDADADKVHIDVDDVPVPKETPTDLTAVPDGTLTPQ